MSDLHTLTTLRLVSDGPYAAEVPSGWRQGRGLFGGLVAALFVRAIEAHANAPERLLRSLTMEVPAPVAVGPATLRLATLRTGTGVSTIAAQLEQAGAICAHAVGVLGRAR